jgi:two-component system KDP operon response regulator KdpE
LQALVCHGKLVQQTQLLIDIWGPSHKEDTYLRIVIASLRKKLGDNPQQP